MLPSIEFRWASINAVPRLSIQGEQEGAKNLHAKKFGASQRAIIAARLRPFYDEQAKERYEATVGRPKKDDDKLVQKVAPITAKSRDAAGKAATKKVTKISLQSNGENGRRCRWNQGWSD